jgi:hypothetical protein
MPTKTTLLIVLASAVGLVFIGWKIAGWQWEGRLLDLRLQHAQELQAQTMTLNTALNHVRSLEQQGDALAATLIIAEAARVQNTQEKTHEIRQRATGARCLDAATVGVLNAPAAPTGDGLRLPPASRDAIDPTALFATDSDVGVWIAQAQAAYDSCRERIDGLRQWAEHLEVAP